MIAASLFSGIGAPEVAMPHWNWAWHAEIEKFPSTVMATRHPNSINLGDVTEHDFTERAAAVARPDILVFGSPCQDFSVAGKRLGLDGARGNLALTALAIVDRLKPRWFSFENVPGLLSNWSGGPECPSQPGSGIEGIENSDFAAFLGTVDELRYSGAWVSLDAQYRGLAQRRDRLFFVGHFRDWRYPAAVLFEPEGLCGNYPPRRETGKGIAPTIASRPTGGGGLSTDFDCDGGLIAGTMPAAGGTERKHGHGWGQQEWTKTPAVTFQTRIARNGRGLPEEVVPSLNGCDAGATSDMRPCIATSTAVRRLTPRECERLQGFPDNYTLITCRGKSAADGPRYKALGNSMAVPVIRWILSRIEILENKISTR